MRDVPSERLNYREDHKTSGSVEEPAAHRPQKSGRAGENDSQASSQQFFSSNSTITTIDTVQQSKRDAVGKASGRDDGNGLDCRVYIPQWLVNDGEAKQRLLCEFWFPSCSQLRTSSILIIHFSSLIKLISVEETRYKG